MRKRNLILVMITVCVCLSGCIEKDLPVIGESIQVGDVSGEILESGELLVSGNVEKIFTVSLEKVDSYMYEQDDEFAKLHGDGIEKYQISGMKDEKRQKLINDNLSTLYEEMMNEYKNHVSAEYLPSLNVFVILENEKLLSFCISRKWLTNNETFVNEYYTIDKNTGELMELADFYDNKVGFLSEISNQVYDEFEFRKEKFKTDYQIDDSYFFDLTEEDFYDKILLDQESFYVSEKGELIYYFQKYEIGPGVIGDQEFILIENVGV